MSQVVIKFALFFMLLASPVSGQIVEDTNIEVGSIPGSFGLTVFQTPFGEAQTDVAGTVTVAGSTAMLLFEFIALDEGSDWFAANRGDPFTRDTIDSGQIEISFTSPALTVEVDQSFFLGVNTGFSANLTGFFEPPNRQHFGWGEFLVNQNGELQILDSAVAYDRGGIIVGESVAIPEPSSELFILAGTAFLFLRRSRCNSTHRLNCPTA